MYFNTSLTSDNRGHVTGSGMGRPDSGESLDALLMRRAKDLAAPLTEERRSEDSTAFLEFHLARERYAVELSYVSEVLFVRDITSVPGTPPFIVGITGVRGRVLSLVDLKRFFGLPTGGITESNRVVVLTDAKMEFGILADGITGISMVDRRSVLPPPATLSPIGARFIMGIVEGPLILFNAGSILAEPMMVVIEGGETPKVGRLPKV